jgi:hypothetical protein
MRYLKLVILRQAALAKQYQNAANRAHGYFFR